MPLLSILIPVYNEQNTILTVIKKALDVPLPAGVEREIIAIDDGSTDDTGRLLETLKSNPRVCTIKLKKNQGKTAAVVQGLAAAKGDILLIQDADLEYDPKYYPELVAPILAGQEKVVYGSRFLGRIQKMTFINWFANRISYLTINGIFKTRISDFHTGFKVFAREI